MSIGDIEDLCRILYDVLQIDSQHKKFTPDTALLGSLPEFDSMAVVSVITAIEDNFGIIVDDDEVSAELFETVGTLHRFIRKKTADY